jgi:hypothetical protein
MSFPSQNSTSDYDKYTKQYLANLALQIQLNQTNFNKNVAFMKTGVQDTDRSDSRSIEERAADVETLKVQARVMLNKITDSSNTNEVLDYLVKNGELLFFFIQQFPSIEKIVKEQFSGGIRAPLLISLIYKKFATQQEETLLPESEDFQIVQNALTQEDVDDVIQNVTDPWLKIDLQRVKGQLPAKKDLTRIMNDPIKYQAELKLYADKYRDGLSREDINKIIETANDSSVQDTNQATLYAENELFNKVNDYLASNPNTTSMPVIPSRSSVSKKIPKLEVKSITSIKTPEVKLAEKAVKTEQQAKQTQPIVLAELQQKQLERQTKNLAKQQSKQLAKQQSNLILQNQIEKEKQLTDKIAQAQISADQQKYEEEYAQFIKEIEDELEQEQIAASKVVATPTRPFQKKLQTPSPVKKIRLGSKPRTPRTPTTPKSKGTGLLNENEQMTHRFKVLKGELLAGNNSKSIVKEMKSLVKKLVEIGELTNDQSLLILKDLKTV